MLCSNSGLTQSPPFSTVTIKGKTANIYNRVSLFKSGRSRIPLKTEKIWSDDGEYSIDIDIPDDMHRKGEYFYTDMCFWKDSNENGERDPGEATSCCHFIIWIPSRNKILFQVYQGPLYEIDSSLFKYNYKR